MGKKGYGTSRSILGFYRIRDAGGSRLGVRAFDRASDAFDTWMGRRDARKARKAQARATRRKGR